MSWSLNSEDTINSEKKKQLLQDYCIIFGIFGGVAGFAGGSEVGGKRREVQ